MTNELRPDLPPLPGHMAHLPVDKRGFPVPYFVKIVNGEPDHRIVEPLAMQQCVRFGKCWLCGRPLGAFKAFVLGPMCAITLTSAEPPSHLECARYAAKACPFLSRPNAKRREAGMPEEASAPGGVFLKRNPGVSLVWTTKAYKPFMTGNAMLFEIEPPESMEWYAEGRKATREEVEASIASGLPNLITLAKESGAVAVQELEDRTAHLITLVRHQLDQRPDSPGGISAS